MIYLLLGILLAIAWNYCTLRGLRCSRELEETD